MLVSGRGAFPETLWNERRWQSPWGWRIWEGSPWSCFHRRPFWGDPCDGRSIPPWIKRPVPVLRVRQRVQKSTVTRSSTKRWVGRWFHVISCDLKHGYLIIQLVVHKMLAMFWFGWHCQHSTATRSEKAMKQKQVLKVPIQEGCFPVRAHDFIPLMVQKSETTTWDV